MRVSVGHSADTGDGCTEWSVLLDDEIEGFDPLRTSDMCAMARDLFRNMLADLRHDQAEHDPT